MGFGNAPPWMEFHIPPSQSYFVNNKLMGTDLTMIGYRKANMFIIPNSSYLYPYLTLKTEEIQST